MTNAIELRNITKRFPGVLANDRINFSAKKAEIHGLLGENGAGKTVLMSILYGLYRLDEGEILINGEEVNMENPATAIRHGIGMVHQHFMLVPSLTVAENIVLGNEQTGEVGLLNRKKMIDEVEGFCERFKLEVDPSSPVYTLSVGVQQRVEILKALYRGANLLILDEPTAVLTPQEVGELFRAIKNLRDQGKTVIFISHKLNEVLSICDRITVLKRGKVMGTVKTEETNIDELAIMMVGREVFYDLDKGKTQRDRLVLKVDGIKAIDDRGLPALRGLNLEVYASEILGVAGVEGNGQKELVEVLMGLKNTTDGSIVLDGEDITSKPTEERIEMGIAHIPEDRYKRGVILDFSVMENLILGSHCNPRFTGNGITLDKRAASNFAKNMVKEYSIQTPSINTLIKHLSGGTQQRVILAREFSREPRLIIASQPTRGLDVGATSYVREKLINMRDEGSAILLFSAELDEIWALSDRIAVIYEGKIVAVREPEETDEKEIGLLMTGGKVD